MKKWDVVKAIIKDWGNNLPLALYREPVIYRYVGIEKNYIVIEVYSYYSQKRWDIKLTPTQFLDKCYVAESYKGGAR